MKKKIEVISVDTSLLEWGIETFQKAPNQPSGAGEWVKGLSGMLEDAEISLLLTQENAEEILPDHQKISCGDLSIFIASRKVMRGDIEISLTPKEFDILYFLAKNRGTVFTKEQIYQAVWDDAYLLDDSNIMAFIRKLRKKIEPNPDAPQYILTIWGIGYKFNDTL